MSERGKKMRLNTLGGLAAIGLLLSATPVRAQNSSDVSDRTAPNVLKGDTYVGAQFGVDFIGDTHYKCRCDARQSDFLLYGGRFGHFFTDHVAGELTLNWIDLHPGFYDASLGVLYDFTPTQLGWNTYATIGGGTEREHVSGRGEGFAYAAVGSEYRFNPSVGARFELRGEHVFGEPFYGGGSHTDVQPNVGVVIHFGAPAPPPPPPPPAPEMPQSAPPPAPAPAPASPPTAPPAPVVEPAPQPRTSADEIGFDRGKARITNIAKAVLDRVAARLKDDLGATVVITGYPDASTPDRDRERLASERAENAKDYLMTRHGIDPGRISTRTGAATPDTAGNAQILVTYSRGS
jgi:outer membrane protein OmpA-like peptidoglycan-associated protein